MASDLVARLKGRGLELPSFDALELAGRGGLLSGGLESSAGGGGQKRGSSVAVHKPLEVSAREKLHLFTPLADRGSAALKAEAKLKEQGESDLLDGTIATLKSWVQECLARGEKQQKLLAKGVLKCRVQAPWSEGLNERLKRLIASYGGRLAADSDKENSARPAWQLERTEKWLVAFDAGAFEAFVRFHPEVLGPPEAKFRACVGDFVRAGPYSSAKAVSLRAALEKSFGPLSEALLMRAEQLASDGALVAPDRPAAKRAKLEKEEGSLHLTTIVDAAWAVAVLAPLGLRAEGGAPVIWCPNATAQALLSGLAALAASPRLQEALRGTQIGKVVNSYRHNPSPEVAQAARELVVAWKAAVGCAPVAKGGPRDASQ